MGCASSSPFVTSTGGVLTAAKGAATDAVHVGEDAINDVKDTLNEKVGHVKEAVIGAVQNVGHGIENAFAGSVKKDNQQDIGVMDKEIMDKVTNGMEKTESTMKSTDYKIIPLKDPADKLIDDALDDISETYDENINDVKDMIRDTTDTIKDTTTNLSDDVDKILSDSSPIHSIDIDSLKTTSPEPEIELALANKDPNIINPPTPKPTYSELEKLQSMTSDDNEISKNNDRINKRIEKLKDEHVGGIYEHHPKITDSQIALIREGVAAAAVPGVTGVLSKNEKIVKKPNIRRTRIPDIKKNLNKSYILNGNIATRWEKRHDKLAQMKTTNKTLQRRQSSDTLWSGSSGEFTKPRTMYLVFGNNFLKTPKIKIIDGNSKTSRWMKKEKLDTYELDLYTGITELTKTDNLTNEIKRIELEPASRWTARPLQEHRSLTPERFPTMKHLQPLTQQRPLSEQQPILQRRPPPHLRPLSPIKYRKQQTSRHKQNLEFPKTFQNNEKFRIIDDIANKDDDDKNSDKNRKEKAAEWVKNNVMEKFFDEIPIPPLTNKFADLVDKNIKISRIEKLFIPRNDNNEDEQKPNSLEINNVMDVNRKISIDGFLDDFRELKKGNSITKFRKADEIRKNQKSDKSYNRESFKKFGNKKMDQKIFVYGNKNQQIRNRFIRDTKSFFNYD